MAARVIFPFYPAMKKAPTHELLISKYQEKPSIYNLYVQINKQCTYI